MSWRSGGRISQSHLSIIIIDEHVAAAPRRSVLCRDRGRRRLYTLSEKTRGDAISTTRRYASQKPDREGTIKRTLKRDAEREKEKSSGIGEVKEWAAGGMERERERTRTNEEGESSERVKDRERCGRREPTLVTLVVLALARKPRNVRDLICP